MRILSTLGGVMAIFCLLQLGLWLIGIVFTDRFLLSQYLFWFNPAFVLAAGGFLLIGWALKRLAGIRKSLRTISVLFAIALLVMVGRELGIFRWVANLGDPSPPKGQAIRIAHWNLSQFEVPERVNIGDQLAVEGTPDIVFISMQNNHRLWDQITATMKTDPKNEITMLHIGGDKIFSRFPVQAGAYVRISFSGKNEPLIATAPPLLRRTLAWAFMRINVQNRSLDEIEDATIIPLAFDTRSLLGRTTVAWFIDMPSNPLVSRSQLVERVAARAAALQQAGTLPAPDFIVGDFNIPAGSASLKTYAPGFTDAVATAGLGRLATWPRPSPMLHIDHLLVSPSWRAAEYRILETGASEHMAQTALLWPATTAPATAPAKP